MKILCFSDLHLHFYSNTEMLNHFKDMFSKIIRINNPDCIVISGDIFEYNFSGNPYKVLRELVDDTEIPVICTLGNHEFAYRDIDKTHRFYRSIPVENRYNVHYLDIENSFELSEYNFIGNVFWYDNSLGGIFSTPNKIVSNWLDSTIKNFVPSIECKKNQEIILSNIKLNKKNILVTHTVPHIDLNRFSKEIPESVYNQYSGCKDFLSQLKDKNVVCAICGHTHRREIKEIYNIKCINVGNDYFSNSEDIKNYVVEV